MDFRRVVNIAISAHVRPFSYKKETQPSFPGRMCMENIELMGNLRWTGSGSYIVCMEFESLSSYQVHVIPRQTLKAGLHLVL
jgi:hypothetical protein